MKLRISGRGSVYTLSRIKSDRCGHSCLSKIAHMPCLITAGLGRNFACAAFPGGHAWVSVWYQSLARCLRSQLPKLVHPERLESDSDGFDDVRKPDFGFRTPARTSIRFVTPARYQSNSEIASPQSAALRRTGLQ